MTVITVHSAQDSYRYDIGESTLNEPPHWSRMPPDADHVSHHSSSMTILPYENCWDAIWPNEATAVSIASDQRTMKEALQTNEVSLIVLRCSCS